MKRLRRILIITAIIIAVGICVASVIGLNISRTLDIMAPSVIQEDANRIINQAIRKAVNGNPADLLICEKDDRGDIQLMKMDSIAVNNIAADAADYVNEEIAKMAYEGCSVPLGNLFNSPYTFGMGPDLRVRVMRSGSVIYKYGYAVTEAGINQTCFSMSLILEVPLIYYCGFIRGEVCVKAAMPVYEVIIVGDVPDTYAKLNEAADFMNLMP